MMPTLALLAAALYVAAGTFALRAPRAVAMLAGAALVVHALLLVRQAFPQATLALGIAEALSAFSWQAAVLLWAFCLRMPLHALGTAVFPVAAAGLLAATFWPTSGTAIPLADWKLQVHVVLSLFSAGLLTLAAAQAVTLAVQDRLLHQRSAAPLAQAMPPLQTMEKALFQLIGLGFFLLSLSLVSGLLFVDNLFAQHLVHKTVLSITAWAMFGVLLWGRWQRGWRGRIAIRWALAGYVALLAAYFGSKFVLEEILGRHWT